MVKKKRNNFNDIFFEKNFSTEKNVCLKKDTLSLETFFLSHYIFRIIPTIYPTLPGVNDST